MGSPGLSNSPPSYFFPDKLLDVVIPCSNHLPFIHPIARPLLMRILRENLLNISLERNETLT